MGKTTVVKPHSVNLRSPFPRIHYYQNKWLQVKKSQYLLPTYSWTLTPIHNWIWNVIDNLSFQCMAPNMWLTNRCMDPSTWLTHQLEKDVGCKVLQFIHTMKIKKLFGYKTLGTHTQQLLQEKDKLGQFLSPASIWVQQQLQQPLHPVKRPLK